MHVEIDRDRGRGIMHVEIVRDGNREQGGGEIMQVEIDRDREQGEVDNACRN